MNVIKLNKKILAILIIIISIIPILIIANTPKENFLASYVTIFYFSLPILLVEIILFLIIVVLESKIIRNISFITLLILLILHFVLMFLYLFES
jgi:hypothetical protein